MFYSCVSVRDKMGTVVIGVYVCLSLIVLLVGEVGWNMSMICLSMHQHCPYWLIL